MKTQIIILIFVLVTGLSYAQTGSITNINTAQRTDGSMTVDIYYDLAGSQSKFMVTAEASFDGGSNFTTINQVSGDIGYDVVTGTSKHITWNFGSEFPGTYSATTQVRLTAGYNCGFFILDERDGQTYNTVQIGDHCWMAENLNIGTWSNGAIPKQCYNSLESNCDIYGGLYSWNTVMNQYPNFICPTGWSVPTDNDWCEMTTFLDNTVDCSSYSYSGTDVGTQLKSSSGWNLGGNGSNTTGFNALPGGSYSPPTNTYGGIGEEALFWTSTPALPSDLAWYRSLWNGNEQIFRNANYKTKNYSVRCIK
jgi:uncharacterized protein (TIGR02145 family)